MLIIILIYSQFECCGVDNYTDYDMATAWNSTYSINRNGVQFTGVALVPPTCCKMVDSGKFPGSMDEIEFLDLETCMLTANASTTNKIVSLYLSDFHYEYRQASILLRQ